MNRLYDDRGNRLKSKTTNSTNDKYATSSENTIISGNPADRPYEFLRVLCVFAVRIFLQRSPYYDDPM